MELKKIALTVLSNGGGQDTTMIIHRLCTDKEFYNKHVQGKLLVVGSDTGDEHEHTYENVRIVNRLCRQHGIEAYWLEAKDGYHSVAWQSLTGQYRRNNSVGSAAFLQTCTDNLKVKVVDRFVEHWIAKNFYDGIEVKKGKGLYHRFYEDHGSIRLLLGFAAQEEGRCSNGNKYDPAWKKKVVTRAFPLIEEGIDRQAAINYNAQAFSHKVWPSNCKRCFYQSEEEILWLYRFQPKDFWEWVDLEKAKINKYADREKNFGVYGKITLEQKLKKAIEKFGHWTDEQLNEYKFSHGHCIKSKY